MLGRLRPASWAVKAQEAVIAATTTKVMAASPTMVQTRPVSYATHRKTIYNVKNAAATEYPQPIVPKQTESKSAEMEGIMTTAVHFDHPMPAFKSVNHPELQIANEELFAVLNLNGSQFKVGKDDVIMANHLDVQVGDKLLFDQVLLVGSRDYTVLGKPFVPGVEITATVEEQTTTQRLNVFKMRRRTGYKRLMRVSPMVTLLRINDIVYKKEN